MKLTTCPVFRLRVASEEQQQQQLVYVKWVCLVFRCNSWSRTCLAYSQFYNAAYSRPINSMISSCIWKTRATTHLCRFLCMQIAVSHWLKITQNVAFENSYFRHFPPIFLQLKLTGLVTLFDRKLLVFRNSPKWTIFGFFKWIFVFLNCNVAQFVRNFEWDLFLWFSNTVMPGGIPSFLSKIDFFPNGNFSGFSIIQIPCWVRKRCHKNFFL